MRRWGIADYLGVGLAVIVGGVGFILLSGIWVITQRDLALAAGAPTWVQWDKALSLWAYGALVLLLLLAVGVALWWWGSVARGLLSLRDYLRGLLWEGREPEPVSFSLPQEAQEVSEGLRAIAAFLRVIQEAARGERHSVPPHASDWPPFLREGAETLIAHLTHLAQRKALSEALFAHALMLLRYGQQESEVERYVEKAGQVFLQAVGAAIGAFYRLEGDKLRRVYAYAYSAQAPEVFQIGEGWVGQVAREGHPLWLTAVPAEYEVGSGLGRATPHALAILPVIAGATIRGVWDLASFTEWDPVQRETAEALLPFFAIGYLLVEEAQRDTLLQKALTETQRSLEAERHRLADMATQHDSLKKDLHTLKQRLSEAEEASVRLNQRYALQQKYWETIIEHLSEVVALFDSTGRLTYLSPSVTRVLGYAPAELQVFFRPVEKSDADAVKAYFSQLLHTEGEPLTLRFRYRHKAGHTLWVEAAGQNYLHHPAIQGILLVLRDITEQVEYEKQYRTRLKFQSLVENSPDIIFRTDREGRFLYVNPSIERYTGYPPSHYIRNTIYSVGFSLEEVHFWQEFIGAVFSSLEVQSAEIDFPSIYGIRRMAVRGIPEVGPEGEIETMVVLLQDITELRQVQEQLRLQNIRLEQAKLVLEQQKRELEEKNRDIMESITYARRIQGALIPGEEGLAEFFPDSFVLHYLRDVVGGDFYWYGAVDNKVVVAVVDCTGHGVPGAFMTFLGYTLLETAVHERRILTPSEILYFMDMRLREMFAGQESVQDGMDVALCVIEPERRLLRFAGAHRPLLLYQNATWSLVAGAPAGLGGAAWLGEVKQFTTHTFSYQPGDQIYLYSDGFLDQFDQEGTRRYSHRRFREFVATWGHLPMKEQAHLLVEELNAWKGASPLTDDVTVVGIRL
ncbi:MAG: PAS domain S-box protein [Bacteroidia bacterium]|nr:PAS domain S-box protein [Bacteroidia bacterium]